jgi:DNA-binding MarR family transcriptional regulator
MVKQSGQPPGSGRAARLPDPPDGVPADELHQTANLVHSAALRLLRRARTADTGMDLDGPRASLLSVLVFAGPQPVTRLADIEQVSAPAISKLVTSLERDGLVERRTKPDDRRVVLVTARPAGRRLLERGRAGRVRLVADLLTQLTPRELGSLRRSAQIIARALARSEDRERRRR